MLPAPLPRSRDKRMTDLTTAEILDRVQARERATLDLRARMEGDLGRYLLDPYVEHDVDGNLVKGFLSYTSNAPQVYADRVKAWLSQAQFIVRIPTANRDREQRKTDSIFERFIIGLLKIIDERLESRLQGTLQGQLSFFNVVRGIMIARAIMYRDRDDEETTIVDVQPWDPMNVTWAQGANGLLWACHSSEMTADEIVSEWGIDYESIGMTKLQGDARVKVYDYFDREKNIVFTDRDHVLKPWTIHGANRTPVVIKAVGDDPLIRIENRMDAGMKSFGESVFKSNREVYDHYNRLMSIYLELVARQRDPGWKTMSRDGSKTLEESPWIRRSEIPLAEGEDVKPHEFIETTRDASILMGLVGGEAQRGSVPHTVYGDLNFQLSGFAINTLKQGLDAVIGPRIKALGSFYRQIIDVLTEQYLSGAFPPLVLSGKDRQNNYFSEMMEPALIAQGGKPEITFVGSLPEDDTAKLQQAQIARQPGPNGQPLFDDRTVHDRILKTQDTDSIIFAIRQQMFEMGTPEAAAYSAMMAAADQGEMQYAQIAFNDLQMIMLQKMQLMQQARSGMREAGSGKQEAGSGKAPAPKLPGVDNAILPQEMLGMNTPTNGVAETAGGAMGGAAPRRQ